MPGAYGILDENSASGLLPWARATSHLVTSRNFWIHTTRPDGRPHVKPVWGLWFEEVFYFSTNPTSVSGRNISSAPWLSVHLESGDDAVILEGKASVVTDPILLSRLDKAYYAKYSYHIESDAGLVYALHHKVAFAWLETDFVGSATKYTFQS